MHGFLFSETERVQGHGCVSCEGRGTLSAVAAELKKQPDVQMIVLCTWTDIGVCVWGGGVKGGGRGREEGRGRWARG